jgi:hypothetical protein
LVFLGKPGAKTLGRSAFHTPYKNEEEEPIAFVFLSRIRLNFPVDILRKVSGIFLSIFQENSFRLKPMI